MPGPEVFAPDVDGWRGLSREELHQAYSIDRCRQWILDRKFKKVAIQFPRHLFLHMPAASFLLEASLPGVQITSVLSSFSVCCVNFKDTMYRAHEAILQFGHSCLTQSAHIPVLRVFFPALPLNVAAVAKGLLSQPEVAEVLGERRGASGKELVVLYDTRCAHAVGKLEAHLRAEGCKNFQVSRLLYKEEAVTEKRQVQHPDQACACTDDYSASVCDACLLRIEESAGQSLEWVDDSTAASAELLDDSGIIDSVTYGVKDNNSIRDRSRVNLNGRVFYAPCSMNRTDLAFAYVGENGPTVTSIIMKWPQCSFHVVHPETGCVETVNAVKLVMQRNYKIEQIRDQPKIGILHSNINLPGRKDIQRRLEKLIKQSGKKYLNIMSCDPNVPKLKNFEDIDLFVYISCPESTICRREVDPEMFKLLCTPWEVELALNPNREWSLNYETNSAEILPNGNNFVLEPETDSVQETVNVSLLSNKTQSLGVSETAVELGNPALSLNSETGALMTDSQLAKQVQRVLVGRSKGLVSGDVPFAGLNPDEEPIHPIDFVAEGRKGIASEYVEEPHEIKENQPVF